MTALETSDTPAQAPARPTEPGGGLVQLLRNSFALLVAQLASWVLAFAVNLFLPRYLGPAVTGQVYLAVSIANLAGLALGLAHGTLMTKSIARAPDETGRWLSNGLTVRAALGGLSLAVLPPLLALLGYSQEVIWLVLIVTIGGQLGNMADLFSSGYHGLQWMGLGSALVIFMRLVSTVATLSLIFLQRPVVEIVAVSIPVAVLQLGLLAGVLWRRGHRLVRPDPAMIRRVVAGSLAFLAAGLSFMIYSQLNTLLLSALATDEAVAWYGVALRLLGSTMIVPGVLLGGAFPMLARLFVEDQAAMLAQARRVLIGLLLFATPPALLVGLYGTPIVTLLYGPRFAPGGPVLQVFGLVLVATYLNIFVARLLEAMDRQRVWAIVMLVAACLALPVKASLIMLAQPYGLASVGAAAGLLISELAMTIPGLVILHRHQLARVCLDVLARCGLAILVAGAALLAFTPISLWLAGALAALAYGGMVWWLRLVTPADLLAAWRMVWSRVAARLPRASRRDGTPTTGG